MQKLPQSHESNPNDVSNDQSYHSLYNVYNNNSGDLQVVEAELYNNQNINQPEPK